MNRTSPDHSNDIDLIALWQTLWGGKWWITACGMGFGILAMVISLLLPNQYEADVLLSPATDDSQGVLGNLTSQLGGLASLAGINLQGGSKDNTQVALAVLQSRDFLSAFANRHHLAAPLFGAKEWNPDTQQWVWDTDVYDPKQNVWHRDVSPPFKPEPSDWEMVKKLREEVLSVDQDKVSGLVTVSVRSLSPEYAQKWASELVDELNDKMKAMDRAEAKRSIDYLNEQLNKTPLSEVRNIFYQLIQQQVQKMMLIETRDQYAFKVIDPAVVPLEKVAPRRALITIAGGILGGLFGIFLVLFRRAVKDRKQR